VKPCAPNPDVAAIISGVLQHDRAALARAITRIESSSPKHQLDAHTILQALTPHSEHALRLGITGVPGAGKSTLIERLGGRIIDQGQSVAVLAIDPSSIVTGGSILGDRTRMSKLSAHPKAFIRPSPAGRTLGGVARRTREAAILCAAAGFDIILIETVGVGQSETLVADMVDAVLALGIAGSGDQLQGVKRGVLEIVDFVAINKADGDNQPRASAAAADLRSALAMLHQGHLVPPVLTCSALTGTGISELWQTIQSFLTQQRASGELARKRANQMISWTRALIEDRVLSMLRNSPPTQLAQTQAEQSLLEGKITPACAADHVINAWLAELRNPLAQIERVS
jgi:LAO/AO transport system kinase